MMRRGEDEKRVRGGDDGDVVKSERINVGIIGFAFVTSLGSGRSVPSFCTAS